MYHNREVLYSPSSMEFIWTAQGEEDDQFPTCAEGVGVLSQYSSSAFYTKI